MEVIDVDALPDPPSDDSDIVFTGFKRDVNKSKLHYEQLDTEGITYIGFDETPKHLKSKPSRATPPVVQKGAGGSTGVATANVYSTKRSSSTSQEDVRPVKRHKATHKPSTTNPHLKRNRAAMKAGSRPPVDVISISDSEPESDPDTDWVSEDDEPPAKRPALTDPGPENPALEYLTDHLSTALTIEASTVKQAAGVRALHTLSTLQQQSSVFKWPSKPKASKPPQFWYACREGVRADLSRLQGSRWHKDFSMWMGLQPSGSIRKAPGDINTITQSRNLIVTASAVADGAADDHAGPYNKEGALVVWAKTDDRWSDANARVVDAHSDETVAEADQPRKHHFTVNDVAIDPSCCSRFASAGRDRRVLLWDCASVDEGLLPEMVEEIECEDNPEVIKYRPDGSTLAIQCDNGSVYLYSNRATRKLEIVRASRGHVTAEMAWGLQASSDMLFASTACLNDASGVHKAFDVTRNKVVVEFDANKEACSTLALDPSGDRLFIATEGPETTYILRQFDVRARTRKAVHRIELEPFVDLTDKAAIDINSLSLSADGLYLAAGRTDNWVDVYDARMLARGPLHSLAHEDSDKPRRSYGVVKTQWVDGAPYGVGLVSGGADGCVRLWDVRRSSDDPRNGTVLARCDNDVSTFTLGDMYRGEAPLIVGESSGMVTVFEHIGSSY